MRRPRVQIKKEDKKKEGKGMEREKRLGSSEQQHEYTEFLSL